MNAYILFSSFLFGFSHDVQGCCCEQFRNSTGNLKFMSRNGYILEFSSHVVISSPYKIQILISRGSVESIYVVSPVQEEEVLLPREDIFLL